MPGHGSSDDTLRWPDWAEAGEGGLDLPVVPGLATEPRRELAAHCLLAFYNRRLEAPMLA